MKTTTTSLTAHLQLEVTTMVMCWKVTRIDGLVLGFTAHDRDMTISSVAYASLTGFTPTAIRTTVGLAVDNLDVDGLLVSPSLTEEDLVAGKWDFAEVEVFEVNYKNLAMGTIKHRKGHLGEIKTGVHNFSAELRGLTQFYTNIIGELYSPGCRANFGDARCGINVASYTVLGSVSEATADRQTFVDVTRVETSGWFDYGLLTWATGLSSGSSMEVKTYVASNTTITLVLPMPYTVNSGDSYSMVAGDDKLFTTCVSKYNNGINFRGEPHLPGQDKALDYGTH
jgi:uncharacterized phage protein (TIGR02218 family)